MADWGPSPDPLATNCGGPYDSEWEALEAKEKMIAMSVSCVDSCQILSCGGDPIGLSPSLFLSDKRIHHHGISQTVDESR